MPNNEGEMTDLIAVQKIVGWEKLKTLVLDSVSSPITKRVYNMALDEFLGWFQQAPRPGFTKATVSAWRVSLEDRGLGSSSIIIRMSAIRKLAAEAADNGLLATELAAGISRVKSAKTQGIRTGNWLSQRQAQALLSAPDISTLHGLRDRAILAVLLGCGLRRSEVAALTFGHLQQRDGRWCIVDLVGKHGRVRTAPMPTWVKVAIDAWTLAPGLADGHVFRSVTRADRVTGENLGEKVVWQLIKPYAEAAGVPCGPQKLDSSLTQPSSPASIRGAIHRVLPCFGERALPERDGDGRSSVATDGLGWECPDQDWREL
jgi:site-specific recombinase XerD